MTDFTSQFSFSDSIRSGFRRSLASITRSLVKYGEIKSRRSAIEALEAKSDAELAKMGLRRDGIAMHVYRDLLYI